jgi:SOS-response transcriptional repressor LexA
VADYLTTRQLEVLRFVAAEIDKGLPPTLREICAHLGVSCPHGVRDHLVALEKKQMLVRLRRSARNIRITEVGYRRLGRVPLESSPPASKRVQPMTEAELSAFLGACPGATP